MPHAPHYLPLFLLPARRHWAGRPENYNKQSHLRTAWLRRCSLTPLTQRIATKQPQPPQTQPAPLITATIPIQHEARYPPISIKRRRRLRSTESATPDVEAIHERWSKDRHSKVVCQACCVTLFFTHQLHTWHWSHHWSHILTFYLFAAVFIFLLSHNKVWYS